MSKAYANPLLVELVVPRNPNNDSRIRSFYGDIGWIVQDDTQSEGYTYVKPRLTAKSLPTIVYGQNTDSAKTVFFDYRDKPSPSKYAVGDSLPFAFDLVEICMAVPSNEAVEELYKRGGELLRLHTVVPLREYYGVQEFRFTDPFNYVLRVTANPGWEM